eukprot:312640-Alexandrium_andersonii.AAC.1
MASCSRWCSRVWLRDSVKSERRYTDARSFAQFARARMEAMRPRKERTAVIQLGVMRVPGPGLAA